MSDSPIALSDEVARSAQEKREPLQAACNATLITTKTGSVLFKLRFVSTGDLELFKQNTESGLLTRLVTDILITEDIKKRYKVNESMISFTIADPWEYDQCHRELTDFEGRLWERYISSLDQSVFKLD